MGQDLIWIVRFRSGGSGLGPRGAALSRRRPKSRGGAAQKPRRTSAFWGLWGLVWAGVWPWSTTTACVTHRRQQGGGSGRGTACAAAKAALRGGAHRRSMFGPNQGWSRGAKCVQGLCAAQVNPYEGRAGLCWAAASSPWRGCGAGGGEAPVTGVPVPIVCHWP